MNLWNIGFPRLVCAFVLWPLASAAQSAEVWQYQEPGNRLYLNNAESAGIVLEDGQTALLALEPDGEWVAAAITLKGEQYEEALTSHLIEAGGTKTTVLIEGEKLFRGAEIKDGMVSYNFLLHSRDLELFRTASIWRVETALYQVEFPLKDSGTAIEAAMAAVRERLEIEGAATKRAEEAMQACDELAADPEDNARTVSGVAWEDIDGAAAIEACQLAAQIGNNNARLHYQLGRAYHRAGDSRALVALTLAALEREYPAAFNALGRLYWSGTHAEQDIAKARGILKRGYSLGNLVSGHSYALLMIEDGDGRSDLKTGQAVLRSVANKGYAPAQRDYGRWLATGRFGSADTAEAQRYLTMAADNGDADAAFDLAVMYRDGDGVDASDDLYQKHLERAAELGHPEASEVLISD